MAATVANNHIIHRGSRTLMYSEITMDSSYAANGEALTAGMFGLSEILGIWPASAKGYTVEAVKTDAANWKLKVYSFSTTTNTVGGDIVAALDLSALVAPVLVVGR